MCACFIYLLLIMFLSLTDPLAEPEENFLVFVVFRYTVLKRHDQFVAFYFYCEIMLISISYNYCSILTGVTVNKCFIETELTS